MAIGIRWVVAITLGLVAGGFALHFPGSYGEPRWNVGAGIFGLVLGLVTGFLVAAIAWVALLLPRRAGVRLLLALGAIVGVTHALNDAASFQTPFVLVQAVAGLVAAGAVAYWLGERRPATLAAVGAAWAVGLVLAGWSGDLIGLPFEETPLGWSTDHAWDGLVVGVVWGSVTAFAGIPAGLRRRDETDAPVVAAAAS